MVRWFTLTFVFFVQGASASEHRLVFTHGGDQITVSAWDEEGMLYVDEGETRDVPADVVFQLSGLTVEDWNKGVLLPRLALNATHSSTRVAGLPVGTLDWGVKPLVSSPPLLDRRLKAYPELMERRSHRVVIFTLWDKDTLYETIVPPVRSSIDRRPSRIETRHEDLLRAGRLQLMGFIYDFEQGLVDAHGGNGLAPFELALLKNDLSLMQELLKGSHDPNQLNLEGFAPVHLAATLENEAAAMLLKHSRSRMNQEDREGWQPLHYAAARGNVVGIERLLAQKARLRVFRDRESTPLHLAISSGSESVVRMLLEAGANPHSSMNYRTPLIFAIDEGRDSMVRLLRSYAQRVSFRPSTVEWTLPTHIRNNRIEIVRLLLESTRASLDRLVPNASPILLAAIMSDPEMLELLVKHGADLNSTNEMGVTALHVAALNNAPLIPWLLERGLDIQQRNHAGHTPLLVAVRAGNESAVRLLLQGGADVNDRALDGRHVLEYAVALARNSIVSQLIAAGSVCDFDPESALLILEDAFYYDMPELVMMTIDQCLPLDFSFEGGFHGWGVADYYGAHAVMRRMQSLGLDNRHQRPLDLISVAQLGSRPQVVEAVLPHYPIELARKYGNQTVRIQLIIDREGRARFPKLLADPVPEMRLALIVAARQFIFNKPDLPEGVMGVRAILPIRLTQESSSYAQADLDQLPELINRPRVRPPGVLRVAGDVRFEFVVNRDGMVDPDSIRVLETPSAELTDLAREVVLQFRFKPGVKDGEPVRTRMNQSFTFR